MKKLLNIVIGFVAYFICARLIMGYGHTETHPFLNEVVVLKFLDKITAGTFTNKEKFKNYEFNWNNNEQPTLTGPALTGDFYLFYTQDDEVDRDYSPMKWISEGGWMEDVPWGPASLSHFYDPLGIDNGKKYLTDNSGLIESKFSELKEFLSKDAKSWVVSDPLNDYSWKIGKESIVLALKETNPQVRGWLMAVAYRSLGQVLHLISDMGCAPHVRNDSHPPRIPLVIGDPDPVEDITKKLDVYELWQLNPPNENLKSQVNSYEKFEDIFEELAKFTNEKFFSGQTIYTNRYDPVIHSSNPYPNPKMTEADYNKSEYTYYKNYDGVNVKMCKDKVAVPFPIKLIYGNDSTRGRPYLDYECVKSIASAVFPNIAEAGANVIRLFIPALKMEITEAKLDSGGVIRGKVTYALPSAEDEYLSFFDLSNVYNGPVVLYINNTNTQIKVDAKKNFFEFKNIPNLKKNDLAVTKLDFGGIILKSDGKKVGENSPAAPTLSSPGNGAANVSLPVTLIWNASSDADNYTLQVSSSSSFSSYVYNQSGLLSTSQSVIGLINNTKYYWRVSAVNAFGTSNPSNTWSFTTISGGSAPLAPSLLSPANGAVSVSVPATLSWNASNGATSYVLQVSKFSSFSSYVYNQSGLTNTSQQVSGLSDSTTYYWRVSAANTLGTSSPSNSWSFTTKSGSIGSSCAGTPTVNYSGKTYNTIQVGTQCWLKENLDVGTMIDSMQIQSNNGIIEKYCYRNNQSNCSTYGGLYKGDEATQYSTAPGTKGICPNGWHIPTLAEFTTLKAAVNNDGNSLKEIGQGTGSGAGTNTSGFSALMSGLHNTNNYFSDLGYTTSFWSSTVDIGSFSYALHLAFQDTYVRLQVDSWERGWSVRCVKD